MQLTINLTRGIMTPLSYHSSSLSLNLSLIALENIRLLELINRLKITTNFVLKSKSFLVMPSSGLVFISAEDGIAETLLLCCKRDFDTDVFL